MELQSETLRQRSERSLSSLIDSRTYSPYDLKNKYEDPSITLPPIYSLGPSVVHREHVESAEELGLQTGQSLDEGKEKYNVLATREENYEGFDLPTGKTYEYFTVRWDLWLYFVFYIIILLLSLLFFLNVSRTKISQDLVYPTWAPASWVLMIIWAGVFITSIFSLWVLSSNMHANFYVLLLLMNIIFIMLFIITIWFTGVIILGTIVIAVAILFSIFVCVAMARDSMLAMGLQIPYILFLILLFVISLQISHDSE